MTYIHAGHLYEAVIAPLQRSNLFLTNLSNSR